MTSTKLLFTQTLDTNISCTPECKKALDSYLEIRKRHGEIITGKSPVFREQYNKRDPFLTRNPRFLSKSGITKHLYTIMETAGIRTRIHGIKNAKHEIMLVHGFRKFFNTQLGDNGINLLIKELLMGHKVGLEKSYHRPTEEKMHQEYMKAIPFLTIGRTYVLEKQLEEKTEQLSEIDLIDRRHRDDVRLLQEENRITRQRLEELQGLFGTADVTKIKEQMNGIVGLLDRLDELKRVVLDQDKIKKDKRALRLWESRHTNERKRAREKYALLAKERLLEPPEPKPKEIIRKSATKKYLSI